MAVSRSLINVFSAPVNADLSAKQFAVLYQVAGTVGNDYVDALANTGTMPIGVLLNKPAAQGRAARIAGPGCITKVIAAAAITEGDRLCATTNGLVVTAPSGSNVWTVGLAMEAASGSGAYVTAMIHPARGVQ